MILHIFVALLLGLVQTYPNLKPPVGGKFFYADMRTAETYGMHYIDALVGSDQQHLQLALMSDQFTSGLISADCTMHGVLCEVPQKYNPRSSTSAHPLGYLVSESQLIFGNKQSLVENTLMATAFNDTFELDLSAFGRGTEIENLTFLSVILSKEPYKSNYDGALGLAPYSANPVSKQYNFMWQLRDKGLIDHNVVAVFAEVGDVFNLDANSSVVKFGGWDQSAIRAGHELHMFRTHNVEHWRLTADSFTLGDKPFLDGQMRLLDINSHLPFLYLPEADWLKFAELLEQEYPDIVCSQLENVCYFQKACSQVQDEDRSFAINIFDINGGMKLEVNEKQLFVGGEQFGASPNLCYVTVFQSRLGGDDVWHVGSSLMKNYYVVYDMTPFDELGEDYILIGLGLQNQADEVLERHYNYTSPAYHPERRIRDSSRAKPGVVDSYEMEAPARVPQPIPEPVHPTDAELVDKEDPSKASESIANKTDTSNSTIPAPTPSSSSEVENIPTHDPSAFMSGEKIVPVQIPPATPPPAPSAKSSFESHHFIILIAAGSCLLLLLLLCCCFCRHHSRRSRPILPGSSTTNKSQYIYQHVGPAAAQNLLNQQETETDQESGVSINAETTRIDEEEDRQQPSENTKQ